MTGVLRRLAKPIYNRTIRERLPRKLTDCNGVIARGAYLLDAQDIQPWYKQNLIDKTREMVQAGDRVVDIAAGRGVLAVAAAQQGADVITFEAAESMLPIAEETIDLNRYPGTVDLRRALIGEDVHVYDGAAGAEEISPSDLPACDVLTLDCEGAEESIIRGIEPRPPTIVCETHPGRGVPLGKTVLALESRGYDHDVHPMLPGKDLEKNVVVATLEAES